MRVLHVVTLVSGGGAFGGPVSIAREQCAELARRGHDVTFAAGWDGVGEVAFAGSGVRPRLFRARPLLGSRAFSRLLAPDLVRFVRRHAADFDLAHVHLGRDLITQSAVAALARAGVPYVAQTHGMILPDHRLRAVVVDRLGTRRALDRAVALLALNCAEAADVTTVVGTAAGADVRERIEVLPNGIRAGGPRAPASGRPAAVPNVLFVGRLHPRKRVDLFIETAAVLHRAGRPMTFSIVGADHGELATARAMIRELGLSDVVHYEGALAPERIPERMAAADVLVVPSAIEPFGMVALEAMAAGTPVVMTDTCDIAEEMRARGAALVCPAEPARLAGAVRQALQPAQRRVLVDEGLRAIDTEYCIDAVVDRLEGIYRRAWSVIDGPLRAF